MTVSRLEFASPIVCIDDFLDIEEAGSILNECIGLRDFYKQASVFDGPGTIKVDLRFRRNEALYLDVLFRGASEHSKTLTALRRRIRSADCRKLWHEGGLIFDVINYATSWETVVSRYGTGDFYSPHADTIRDCVYRRLVTLVYYVNSDPARFEGGCLAFHRGKDCIRVEPKHNRVVVFPSSALHSVEAVAQTDCRWEDSRFSVNLWMGFRK